MQRITQLYDQYKNDVYRLALSYTGSVQEAEDICQTVFLKLIEHPNITPGKEKNWLLKVAANESRLVLRSHWWKKTVPLDERLSVEPPEVNEVFQAVMALGLKYRMVVYLHYYQGCSTQEIAEILKLSRTAVTTRLSRARNMLKDHIREDKA